MARSSSGISVPFAGRLTGSMPSDWRQHLAHVGKQCVAALIRMLGGLASGAPELVVEIVSALQVREYVAALIEERRIEWRVLETGHVPADGHRRKRHLPVANIPGLMGRRPWRKSSSLT